MKKNFFKKLSFVIALAMIVSIVAPAASAFAATTPSLYVKTKYLYLNDEGSNKVNEYDFNIKNKVAGSTYKWTSSNEAVAEVDAKTGEVVGLSVGKATITVKITLPTKKTKTLTATVKVRDNIETLAVSNAPTEAIAVNEEINLNRSFTTFNNSTTKTSSITRWTVEGTDATIAADSGIFKATKAGTYKVTAWAFQSEAKYTAWTTSKAADLVLTSATVEIKVVNEIKSVTQLSGTSVKVEFAGAVDSLSTADLTVSYLVSGTPVQQTVKSLTASDDKKSYTVVMYNAFVAGASYRVALKDANALDFTAATTNVADVATLTITPATVAEDVATDVVVKLFNKDGVDITTSTLLSRVTLTNSSEKVWFNTATADSIPELTIYNIGDATTITGVFHTYEYDTTTGLEKNTITGSATITGVAATTYTVGTLTAWTIAASAPTDSFASVNHILAVGDTANLYVKSLKTDGTTVLTNIGTSGNDDAGNWKFTSSDNSVLFVSSNGALSANKAGVATVVVEYKAPTATTYTVVGAVAITVNVARTATTFKLDNSGFTLSKAPLVNDSKTVTLDVEDQYGVDMAETGVSSVVASSDVTNPVNFSTVSGSTVIFNASGIAAGTYNFKVTSNGLVRNIIVTVTEPKNADGTAATAASYYKLSISGTSFDTALSSTDLSEIATLKVVGYAANGVPYSVVAATGSGIDYHVEIFNPSSVDKSGDYLVSGATSTAITLGQAVAGTGTAIKAATGTWTVKLINNSTKVVADVVTFVVKDTQVQPVVSVAYVTVPSAYSTTKAAINYAFTAKLNNTTITPLYVKAEDLFGTGTEVFVKNVRYYDTTLGIEYVVAVGQKITLSTAYAGVVTGY